MSPSPDVERHLRELVTYPRDDLNVELKGWLDPTNNEDRANLAKALIAMANHGGGHVLIGFDERPDGWVAAEPRPENLDAFTQDAINGVVRRYAEPVFHCEVHHVAPEGSESPHPIVSVRGGAKVPVRAKRDGPDQRHITQHTYYIRRPGPESAPPQDGREWDVLIRRCIREARAELLDDIRALLDGGVTGTGGEEGAFLGGDLHTFVRGCEDRWREVVEDRLPEDPDRFQHGWWSVGYRVLPRPNIPSLQDLLELLRTVQGSETGWPPWWVPTREELRPYPHDDSIECWLGETRFRDAAHSDFWKAERDGRLFLLRGYQEDGGELVPNAGTVLDLTLPVWRVGECLLHAMRLAEAVQPETASQVEVLFKWTGLRARRLEAVANPNRYLSISREARQAEVMSHHVVETSHIADQLPEIVEDLTRKLYEVFDFFQPPKELFRGELNRMLGRDDA